MFGDLDIIAREFIQSRGLDVRNERHQRMLDRHLRREAEFISKEKVKE